MRCNKSIVASILFSKFCDASFLPHLNYFMQFLIIYMPVIETIEAQF